jgi:hypothetical protein
VNASVSLETSFPLPLAPSPSLLRRAECSGHRLFRGRALALRVVAQGLGYLALRVVAQGLGYRVHGRLLLFGLTGVLVPRFRGGQGDLAVSVLKQDRALAVS